MTAMTAGALLRAAGRSFASNKSTGLAVAVQQVRLFRGQHSRGSRIGEAPRGTRDIFSPNTDRPSGFALLCAPRVERARAAPMLLPQSSLALIHKGVRTHPRTTDAVRVTQNDARTSHRQPSPSVECAFFLATDKSLCQNRSARSLRKPTPPTR